MPHAEPPTSHRPRRGLPRRILVGLLAATISIGAALLLAEVLLRLLPIPGVEFQPFYYDETTGGRLYPGSRVTWRGSGGAHAERRINSWGFLDEEHAEKKPVGTFRIGFFGDSYTEARQVNLDDTFFRKVEQMLDDDGRSGEVETLAFGVAGRSTVQSYLECLNWMDRADLDLVVYVFCENDPGDQFRPVSEAEVAPFATLVDDSLAIDVSFRDRYRNKGSALYRAAQFLKSKSLVASTVVSRLKLLRRHGVSLPKADAGANAREGVTIMGPASWPSDSLATLAWRTTERVIARWADEVTSSGREYSVLRVPRAKELEKPLAEQDAFAPRLHAFCDSVGIALIDPTGELIAGREAGEKMYFDHFTPAGHSAVARAFVAWFERQKTTEDQ